MAKTLRQKIEDLESENAELQDVLGDYEAKFDSIAELLPEEEDEGDESGE